MFTRNATDGYTQTQKKQSNKDSSTEITVRNEIGYWPSLSRAGQYLFVVRRVFLIVDRKGITMAIAIKEQIATRIQQCLLNVTIKEKRVLRVLSAKKPEGKDKERGTP
jgi:hypothetical protein